MYPQAETALNTWQLWSPSLKSRPKVIGSLNDGLTNQTYKLQTSQGDAVLRLPHPESESLGIVRPREKTILDTLQNKQITADIWFYQSNSGLMVSQFLPGKFYSAEQISASQQQEVQSLIQRYQSINVSLTKFDYVAHLQNYRQQIPTDLTLPPEWKAEWKIFFPQLTNWQNSGWKPVLCHHDLNGKNLVNTEGKWLLLDWEYAAMGHSAIDLLSCGLKPENLAPEEEQLIRDLMMWINRYWSLLRKDSRQIVAAADV